MSKMKVDDAVLSSYLVKRLQAMTEADPNLLARYVSALLKSNKPKEELVAICTEKLLDFLGDKSKPFVQNLFHALEKGTTTDGFKVSEVASTVPAATIVGEVACSGGVVYGRSFSQLKIQPEVDKAVPQNLEREGFDDDRDHEHWRQVRTLLSPCRVPNFKGFLPEGNIKPAINGGLPAYDINIPATESLEGLGLFEGTLPGVQYCDEAHVRPSSHIKGNNQPGLLRGAIYLRGSGFDSSSEHQNNLGGGVPGCAGGMFAEPVISHEQKSGSNCSDFNLPLGSLGSTLKCTSSTSNGTQSSWAEIGQFPGVRVGPYDHLFPHDEAIQHTVGSTVGCSKCPDFEERGYCLRGDCCPMKHGANRIVVQDFQSLLKLNLPLVPDGRDVTLTSLSGYTSSHTCNVSDSNLFTGDLNLPMVDGYIFLKGTRTESDFLQPDFYDPDQPLFIKEQPSALANGFKRLSSFRKDLEDIEGVLKRHRKGSSKEGRFERYSLSDMTQGRPVASHNSLSDNINGSTRHTGDAVVADRIFFVEGYEPECMHRTNLGEEQESLIKSASMKPGITNTSQREVGGCKRQTSRSGGMIGERAHQTLCVSCIPHRENKKEHLNAHFQKFGVVVDIRIPSQGDRAFIQFARREEAEAALESPEAVLGNRFVRLSWAKRDNVPFSFTDTDLATPSTTGHCLTVDSEVPQRLHSGKAKQTMSISLQSEPNCLRTTGKLAVQPFQSTASASSLRKQHLVELMMGKLRRKQDELAHKREDFRRQLERYSKQGFGVAAGLQRDKNRSISSTSINEELNEDESSSKQLTLENLEAGINKSHKEISALSESIEKALLGVDSGDPTVMNDPVKTTLDPTIVPLSTKVSLRGMKGSLVGTCVSFAEGPQASPLCFKVDNCATTCSSAIP